jgi:hypothetical protein
MYILSGERMGLSFTIAAGPRQRSHSQVRVPRNSWSYFTVSDSSPQPGGLHHRIYIPQEQGAPVTPPGKELVTYFPFITYWVIRHGPLRKYTVQHFFCCCVCIHCRGKCLSSSCLKIAVSFGFTNLACWEGHRYIFLFFQNKENMQNKNGEKRDFTVI